MQKRMSVICILLYQFMTVQLVANVDACAEYIDVDRINNMDLVMNHTFALSGSGTIDMSGTGSGTMAPCTGSGTIGGLIYTQYNEPIESVLVELESIQPEFPKSIVTESDGLYAFQNEVFGFNYSIQASRDFDVYNGLSTLDVVRIVQIVYGVEDELSPYSYIAADVNQDQKIDLEDAIQLVQLLIGIRDEFEGSESWLFIDANQQFIDDQKPWPFIDQIDLQNLSQDSLNNDFIGVKLGDVSGDADPAALQGVESRNVNQSHVNIEDIFLQKGEQTRIHFDSNINQDIVGMQLFLDYHKLTVLQINGGKLDDEFASFEIDKDKIFMSWYGQQNQDREHLFSIDVIAESSGYVSDFIHLHENWLPSELYVKETLEPHLIELDYSNRITEEVRFSVDQNYPNPFIEQTNITFRVPKSGQVSLIILNHQGQILIDRNLNATKGENMIVLDRDELSGAGLFHYQINYKSEVITKSFIISSEL